jgi:hypothetical protein
MKVTEAEYPLISFIVCSTKFNEHLPYSRIILIKVPNLYGYLIVLERNSG